jgi:enamine deaminase RidA (YjgF/YER057c/UK114 family)
MYKSNYQTNTIWLEFHRRLSLSWIGLLISLCPSSQSSFHRAYENMSLKRQIKTEKAPIMMPGVYLSYMRYMDTQDTRSACRTTSLASCAVHVLIFCTQKLTPHPDVLSQAIVVNNTVYCSGAVGIDPKTGRMVGSCVGDRTVRPFSSHLWKTSIARDIYIHVYPDTSTSSTNAFSTSPLCSKPPALVWRMSSKSTFSSRI